ncbi:MAG: hypothetical protein KDC98_06125 [Planctomycetes bacterium]|nr:hypothetical protein [Planctomycetota bacterium]
MNHRFLTVLLLPFAALAAQAQPAPGVGRNALLYDIGDLARQVDAAMALPDADAAAPPSRPATNPQPIARLIRAFVRPPLQPEDDIRPIGDRWIVALCRPEQHAWIHRFLHAARTTAEAKAPQRLVTIECTCFTIPEIPFLADIRPALTNLGDRENTTDPSTADGTADGTAEDTVHVTKVLAPGDGTTAFLKALRENRDVTFLVSPALTLQPLTVGHASLLNQTSYVRDFDLQVTNNAIIADPIIDTIQDGIVLEAAVTTLEHGLLGVSLEARVAELKRPIETQEVGLGAGQKVTLQLPHLHSTQIESAVEMVPGNTVVLVPPPLAGKRMLFVVKVTSN